jgi:hypothetical protein
MLELGGDADIVWLIRSGRPQPPDGHILCRGCRSECLVPSQVLYSSTKASDYLTLMLTRWQVKKGQLLPDNRLKDLACEWIDTEIPVVEGIPKTSARLVFVSNLL